MSGGDGVVVSGVGVVAGGARGPDALWEVVCGRRDGLVPAALPGAEPDALVGRAPDVERRDVVRTPVGRRIDRLSLLVLAAARDALADARLEDAAVAGPETGIVLGSAFGNFGETSGFLDRLGARGAGNPLVFPNLVMNAALSYLSIELGVTGPTVMVTQQEVSGEAAVAAGLELLASGAVARCLVGAGDELTPELYAVLREVGALGRGRSHPYARRAAGYVPGEGAAVLVLERERAVRARGVRAWVRVADAVEGGVEAPLHGWPRDPDALAACVGAPIGRAALVVGAAGGIRGLDEIEAAVVSASAAAGTPVVTPRAAYGHFGSAGIVGAVVAALALRTRTVPPGPVCAPPPGRGFHFVERARAVDALAAATVIGVARGGASCALVFEEIADT